MTAGHTASGGPWAHHDQYRNAVRAAVRDAFASIGFTADCRVLLIGFPSGGGPEDGRVEPVGGPYDPDTFTTLPKRVSGLLDQDARHNPLHHAITRHDSRRRDLLDQLRRRAIADALQDSPAGHGWIFFASRSVPIDGLATHVVVAVDALRLHDVPALPDPPPGVDRLPSLAHALIEEVLHRLWSALRAPVDGDRMRPLRAPTSEVVRAAAARFVRAALHSVGGWRGAHADAMLNAVSALPYEGRPGVGTLLLTPGDASAVDVELQLTTPIELRDKRAVRKLVEASSVDAALIVDHDGNVRGIGRHAEGRQPPGLLVTFVGRGAWDLRHDGRALLSVRDGEARLPAPALDVVRLTDLIDRLLHDADTDRLIELARAAGQHHHGAMLVISSDAAGEAARLSPQSIAVHPTLLSGPMLTQLTAMDGAILLDPQGRCHAVGVILDGRARGHGDPARGSRYNNPVRYLDSQAPSAVVIVYSADRGIDLLPDLRPRQDRHHVAGTVGEYVRLVDTRPPPLAQIFEVWDSVTALAFYLSGDQCRDVNAATDRLRSWCAEHDRPLIGMPDLQPDPAMGEAYWLA